MDDIDYSWQEWLKVGEYVIDDLTLVRCKVLDIFVEPGKTVGYRIDSRELNGYRYGWEISYGY